MKKFYDMILNGMTEGKIEKELAVQLVSLFRKDISTAFDDIAIIGMSINLPGSSDVYEFWENILNGIDNVGDFPKSRLKNLDDYLFYHAGEHAKDIKFLKGAYLDEIDKFDYRFFQISPKEANLMDPSHRLFLQNVWQAIEDAGYGGKKIKGSKTGIYVGYNFNNTYKNMISEVDPYSVPISVIGNKASIIASRVSQILDLKGPAMMLDTTCSSSSVSVHLACKALKNGDCDMAVAAGIRLNIIPIYDDNSEFGIVAVDGKTRAFDDDATGMIGGEGLISILLKPLSKAKKDRDNIYAVIKGSAINHDGTSVSITAPNRVSQTNVITKAWKDSGISPETISYIEAFGTGTNLGDAIEIEGLKEAFRKYTDKKQFCAIGSAKTNIGHLYECSGLVGIVKMVMALKNHKIIPTINFNRPNRNIDFSGSPLYVNTIQREWVSEEEPRRCGVSTFGLSGTNSHIVLEEYTNAKDLQNNQQAEGLDVLTISAKSRTALSALLEKYKYFLENGFQHEIKDICYTANTGRGHYEVRLAIIVHNLKDLKQKIDELSKRDLYETQDEPWLFYYEQKSVKLNNEYDIEKAAKEKISEYMSTGKSNERILAEICRIYVQGVDIDWEMLYVQESCRKVALPVYQFDKYECWLEVAAEANELNQSNEYKRFLLMNSQASPHNLNYEVKLVGRDNNEYSLSERLIANVWGEVLGYKTIGVLDNFIEMGGDSLLGIRISSIMSEKTGRFINPGSLLKYQNILEFAKYFDEILTNKEIKSEDDYPKIEVVEERDYYPASYAQKRMFIMNKLDPLSVGYNIYRVVRFKNKVDHQHLKNTIKQIIDRHEVLRTSIELLNDEIIQSIYKDINFSLSYFKADEKSLNDIVKEFKKPFDLSKPPLLRVGLVEIGESESILLIDMHHAITDAISGEIFWREFTMLFQGIRLPEVELQYKDFSVWQNKFMQTESAKKQEKYWIEVFKDKAPILNIPTDYPRPEVLRYEGDVETIYVDKAFKEKIKKVMVETKTSLYMVLLACYNVLLSKYTAQDDIIVGTPIIGRTSEKWNNTIGMFINTIPMRNYPSGSKTFREFLNEVKVNVLNAFDNQDYPIDELANKLKTIKSLNRHFLFDTIFSVRNTDENIDLLNDFKGELVEAVYNISDYDLTFEVIPFESGIKFHLEYCVKLFKKETAVRFLRDFLSILEEITDKLDKKIEDIELNSSEAIIPNYKEDEEVTFNI